jgi:hypothetical protein
MTLKKQKNLQNEFFKTDSKNFFKIFDTKIFNNFTDLCVRDVKNVCRFTNNSTIDGIYLMLEKMNVGVSIKWS